MGGTAEALQFAMQLLAALPQLIQAGSDVATLVTRSREQLQTMADEGRAPTAEEWDALNAEIDRLRGELHGG